MNSRVLMTGLTLLLASCCTAPATRTTCPPCAATSPKAAPPPKLVRPPRFPTPPAKKVTPPPRRLSSNCQAPLPLTEAVSRLLIKAAAHSTSSGACVDGPGTRVAVDRILVCPKDVREGRAVVEANYRVGRFPEGDTRMCRNPCEWIKPTFSEHLATFTFAGKGKVLRLQLPTKLPGLEGMTPLDKPHSGGCYGESGPFQAAEVKLR